MNKKLAYFVELFTFGFISRKWHYTRTQPYCLHIIDFWDDLQISPNSAHMKYGYPYNDYGKVIIGNGTRQDPYMAKPLLITSAPIEFKNIDELVNWHYGTDPIGRTGDRPSP